MSNQDLPEDRDRFRAVVWLIWKSLPLLISGLSIYLGYKLFLLGVTGEASIVVDVKNVSGQLINAAPGLFFAVGGIAALIVTIVKGGKMTHMRLRKVPRKRVN